MKHRSTRGPALALTCALFAAACTMPAATKDSEDPAVTTSESPLTLPLDSLRFIKRSNGTSVFLKVALTGDTVAMSAGELGAVPTLPLSTLDISYTSSSMRTEVGMLSSDVSAKRALVESVFPLWGGSTSAFDYWKNLSNHEGVMPITPYPNDDILFSGNIVLPLADADFHIQGATVREARIYDHGFCSREEPLQPQLDLALDKLTSQLFAIDVPLGQMGVRARLESFLDHTVGDPSSQKGGLLVGVSATATVNIGAGAKEHISTLFELPFSLSNGLFSVSKSQKFLAVSGLTDFDVTGTLGNKIKTKVVNGVSAAVADINRDISTKQGITVGDCDFASSVFHFERGVPVQPVPADFKGSQAVLKLALGPGAAHLGLSNAETVKLLAVIDNPANWQCIPPTQAQPSGATQFIVRAKRFNLYPNAVELVWFDGPDPNSSSYAAYVMANASADPATRTQAVKQLCSYSMPTGFSVFTGKLFYQRAYAIADNILP